MKRKLVRIISLVLCGFILCGNYATAQSTQYIDNSEELSYNEFESNNSMLSFGKTEPQSTSTSAVIKTPFLIVLVRETPGFLGKVKTVLFIGTKVKIKETTENFCLVEAKNGTTGYVFKGWLDKQDKEKDGESDGEYKFNRTYDHVYIGYTNANATTGIPRTQIKNSGNKTVAYSTDNTSIISVDSETGLITGKKAGTAKLIAKVGGEEISIPVYCIYKWKKAWTGKTSKTTTSYSGTSSSTTIVASISSDTKFYVKGDDGGSGGWAYGYADIAGDNDPWGFVKINDISTKNTISYYNKLDFGYPIEDSTIKYISSPYAERSSDLHRGFDITGGGSYIYGKNLVSPVNGSVVFVNTSCTDNGTKPSYGYCITIESNGGAYPKTAKKDTVTGKYFTITFMHMSEAPKYKEGDKVKAGDIIGKIGNTGNVSGSPGVNPIGTHLHLEINNMGVIMGSSLRKDFTYNVNPIYFYINVDFGFNTGSSAYQKSGAYWYGPNN